MLQQRKTEDAEAVEDGADEAKKAKPSEETNGAGDEENGQEAETDEQPPVSRHQTAVLFSFTLNIIIMTICSMTMKNSVQLDGSIL